MPRKPKPNKVGRPKLAEDKAKAKIVPVRFAPEELDRMTKAAQANEQNLSQWIRGVLNAAIQ